jgi:hypothetical protein
MQQISWVQYELSLIMLGALSLGGVLAKSLIAGKRPSSVTREDLVLAIFVGGGTIVVLTAVLRALDLVWISPSKPLLVVSVFAVLLGSVAVWTRIRTA